MNQDVQTLLTTIRNQEQSLKQNYEALKNLQEACPHTWVEVSSAHWSGYECTLCSKGHNRLVSVCYTPGKCEHPPMLTPSAYDEKEALKKQKLAQECADRGHPVDESYRDDDGFMHCQCFYQKYPAD